MYIHHKRVHSTAHEVSISLTTRYDKRGDDPLDVFYDMVLERLLSEEKFNLKIPPTPVELNITSAPGVKDLVLCCATFCLGDGDFISRTIRIEKFWVDDYLEMMLCQNEETRYRIDQQRGKNVPQK